MAEAIRAQCLVGQVLFLADAVRGLHLIDLTDRQHPQRLPDIDTTHSVGRMEVSGQTLMLASPSGLTKAWYSLRDPRRPQLLRQTIAPDPGDAEDCAAAGVETAAGAPSADASAEGRAATSCNRCTPARRGPWRTVRLRIGSTVRGWLLYDGSAGPLQICLADGTHMTLAAGEWTFADAVPSPAENRPAPVTVARVLVSSNVPITLTRTRPDGTKVELGKIIWQDAFDLLTDRGYQARASGYMTGRFILHSRESVQIADVVLARPTARVLGIAFSVLGVAGLIAGAYSAILAASSAVLAVAPCLYCGGEADVSGIWTTAGVSTAVGVAFLIPSIPLLLWGPRSRVSVRASDARSVPPPSESPQG
ncbi:MAG: hypothetical protein JNJ46_00755 [Myxococcales bacterium]|nr:hypothetical protein [Myxococcales bacterium]